MLTYGPSHHGRHISLFEASIFQNVKTAKSGQFHIYLQRSGVPKPPSYNFACLIDHPEKAHRQISLISTYQTL